MYKFSGLLRFARNDALFSAPPREAKKGGFETRPYYSFPRLYFQISESVFGGRLPLLRCH
jgi:hypothetical protein